MIKHRYTLSECWKLFDTDNKGFSRWLRRAHIEPQTSEADHRTKYLTDDQLQHLAAFLNRPLPVAPPVGNEEEPAPVGAYKLLLDQVHHLTQELQRVQQQLTLLSDQMEIVHAQDEERKQRLLRLETHQAELTHKVTDVSRQQDVVIQELEMVRTTQEDTERTLRTQQQDLEGLHTTVAGQQRTLQEHTDQLQLLTTTLAAHQHELQHTEARLSHQQASMHTRLDEERKHRDHQLALVQQALEEERQARTVLARQMARRRPARTMTRRTQAKMTMPVATAFLQPEAPPPTHEHRGNETAE